MMTYLWGRKEPIVVDTDDLQRPLLFIWRGQAHPVARVARHWRVDQCWWRLRVWRDYFKLATTTGMLVVIYRDLPSEDWYLHRLHD